MSEGQNFRTPPSNIEAEKSVLGAIMLKPDAIEDVIREIYPEDFYKTAHKHIFEAMKVAYEKGQTVDAIVLVEQLKKMDKIDAIGGEDILYEIVEATPTSANLMNYVRIVKDNSILRKLADAGGKISQLAYDGHDDIQSILDEAESTIFKVAEKEKKQDIVELSSLISEMYERLDSQQDNAEGITGISSGYEYFDQMTSGFNPADLVIIAARPAMGKTAFLLNIALNAALREDKNVLMFSLEMSNQQLLQRLLAVESKVPLQNIRNGFISEEEYVRLGLVSSKLVRSKIRLAEVHELSALEIKAYARKAKAQGKLDIILVDYLQLLKGSSSKNRDNKYL